MIVEVDFEVLANAIGAARKINDEYQGQIMAALDNRGCRSFVVVSAVDLCSILTSLWVIAEHLRERELLPAGRP